MEPLQSVPFYRLFAAILIDILILFGLALLIKKRKKENGRVLTEESEKGIIDVKKLPRSSFLNYLE